jgi:hypothetical protein
MAGYQFDIRLVPALRSTSGGASAVSGMRLPPTVRAGKSTDETVSLRDPAIAA